MVPISFCSVFFGISLSLLMMSNYYIYNIHFKLYKNNISKKKKNYIHQRKTKQKKIGLKFPFEVKMP